MISSLIIKNYALMRTLELAPSEALNIVTGETGAGKSIMLGAIGLLLGRRADVKVLYDDSTKCIVEGTFNLQDLGLQPLFEELDLDFEEECVIRREINPSGKSRAFVNDSPVTLDVLKAIGPRLIDIHSQHESLELGKNKYQLSTLDGIAQHNELIEIQRRTFSKYKELNRQLSEWREKANNANKELDYQRFILQELESAAFKEDEQEVLEKELLALENAEEIKEKLTITEQLLDREEGSILEQLKEASFQIGKLQNFSELCKSLSNRLESTSIELKDILDEVQAENEKTIHEPERLTEVKERLDLLYRLQQKHNISSITELLQLQHSLKTHIDGFENIEEQVTNLEKDTKQAYEQMMESAKKLSVSRQSAAKNLGPAIEKIIHSLGIENGTLKITFTTKDPESDGIDQVEYSFSANKGMPLRPLKEVASGGEFSRLIFALKILMADKVAMPTVIFDEIDTGVSGEVAIRMIKFMKQMAKQHQIISISHLPQFAAAADQHYLVFKDHAEEKSMSRIKKLNAEERIMHIAEMIGGQKPSEMAQQSARELLENLA